MESLTLVRALVYLLIHHLLFLSIWDGKRGLIHTCGGYTIVEATRNATCRFHEFFDQRLCSIFDSATPCRLETAENDPLARYLSRIDEIAVSFQPVEMKRETELWRAPGACGGMAESNGVHAAT